MRVVIKDIPTDPGVRKRSPIQVNRDEESKKLLRGDDTYVEEQSSRVGRAKQAGYAQRASSAKVKHTGCYQILITATGT